MNSYQRVMTALERGEPDRAPIVEWAVSRKVIKALCPEAKDQSDLEEMLELDGVSTVGGTIQGKEGDLLSPPRRLHVVGIPERVRELAHELPPEA